MSRDVLKISPARLQVRRLERLGDVVFATLARSPASGFILYDNDLAIVETLAGRLDITAPAINARYTRWLEQLRQAATTGTAAAELCRRAAAELT